MLFQAKSSEIKMGSAVGNKKILLAVRPVDLEAVSQMLGTEFNLVICYTLEQAIEHLKEDIGLIACGTRFDAGSMFSLLHVAKASPDTSWIPYYLVIGEDTRYSYSILDGIKEKAVSRGVTEVIDIGEMVRELGKEQAYKRIREGIRRILHARSASMKVNPVMQGRPLEWRASDNMH